MVKCSFCGEEEPLPFRCEACGELFCVKHRLPESHLCRKLNEVRLRKHTSKAFVSRYPAKIVLKASRKKQFKFYTSSKEVRDLALASLILFFVGLSWWNFWMLNLSIILVVVSGIILAFLLHELAHKLAAQYYGAWAEFRISHLGLAFTAFSIFLPLKIIAPGAVLISSYSMDKRKIGLISLSGPLINILLALTFIFLVKGFFSSFLIYFNLFVAFFNLLPIPILDGEKILNWSKPLWLTLFLLTIVLYIAYPYIV